MNLDIISPLNQHVLRYLGREEKALKPAIASPASVPDPYLCQGSHPDIVQRVWDELGSGLPQKCRRQVYGTPALVHNRTGIVIAICNGTQYNLRLTAPDFQEAITKGAKTKNRWSTGEEMDSLEVLGLGWIFGGWYTEEKQWCLNTYDSQGTC
ncbi:MAG: hypothetical protein WCJ02_11770 [bacterium]